MRDQDDIDTKLRDRYLANMQEAKEKTPQMTQKIRGQDMNLDNAMNKLVWGGKANLPQTKPAVVESSADDEKEESTEESTPKESRKTVKKKKKKKKKVDAAELEAIEQAQKKLVLQSLAAGVTIGAAAVAATFLVGSKPK